MIKISVYLIIAMAVSAPIIYGQRTRPAKQAKNVPINIGRIAPSGILEELGNIKRRAPHSSASQITRIANKLLQFRGYNFTISVSGYKTH